jgi:molecular chaperone DnaJ
MEAPCASCDGFGRVKQVRRQKFTLPVGLKPGGFYTLSGADEKTGQATEIFIQALFVQDGIFQIENYDLLCEYFMDFSRHKTGVSLNFKTPFGEKFFGIPAAAQPGDVIIVPNAGLYKNSSRGDQGVLKIILKQKKPSLLKRIFGGWLENQ